MTDRSVRSKIRVRVVPTNERSRGHTARELFSRDAELAVPRRAGGDQQLIVVGERFGDRKRLTQRDVTEVAQPFVLRGALEGDPCALDVLVIRRHAVTEQAERRWEALEQIDLRPLFQQHVRRIEAGRPGSNDGHSNSLSASPGT
ncbi:MAG: hypothetical protein QM756_11305 [Polyangiaceae bacterium]